MTVSQWDTDQASPTYGEPLMFQFNEASVGVETRQSRQFMLHPDRIVVWSRDATFDCRSLIEQVSDWQKGFDQLLMIQSREAKSLSVSLPSPEHFFAIAFQSFAASISMPVKILVGSQSGERASTEDANEWSQTKVPPQ